MEYGPLSNVVFRDNGEVFTIALVPEGTAEDLAWERRERLMPPSAELMGALSSGITTFTPASGPLERFADAQGLEVEILERQASARQLTNAFGLPNFLGSNARGATAELLAPGTIGSGVEVEAMMLGLWTLDASAGRRLMAELRSGSPVDLGEFDHDGVAAIHWRDGSRDRTTIVASAEHARLFGAILLDGHLPAEEIAELVAPVKALAQALKAR